MLVIARKVEESFQIGPDIWVKILSVRGNAVRVGITAPDSVDIFRDDHAEYVPPDRHE